MPIAARWGLWSVPILAVLAVWLLEVPAEARERPGLEQLSGRAGCVHRSLPRCSRAPLTRQVGGIVASADGRHVYAVARGRVLAFRRSPRTGRLQFIDCWSQAEVSGCTSTRALADADGLALSRDGRSLYVGGGNNEPADDSRWTGTLAHFRRDSRTGRLTPRGCVDRHAREGCAPVGNAMASARDVFVTPDGRAVLVVGLAITVLARDPDTGDLTVVRCITGSGQGCSGGDILVGVSTDAQALLSPDGRHLMVSTTTEDGERVVINVLALEGGSTTLVFSSCLVSQPLDPCLAEPRIVATGSDFPDAFHLGQSPDGRFLYASAFTSGDGMSYVVLRRDRISGSLRMRGCLGEARPEPGCRPSVRVSPDPNRFVVSPDGRRLAGAAGPDGSVTLLERDRRSGNLKPIRARRGCMTRTGYVVNPIFGERSRRRLCRSARLPDFPTELTFSPDGRHLYVPGAGGIAVLRVR